MQHLYMMPQARASILSADCTNSKHEPTLRELQRMFAYLLVCKHKTFPSFHISVGYTRAAFLKSGI